MCRRRFLDIDILGAVEFESKFYLLTDLP